jgi:hypothetical protein
VCVCVLGGERSERSGEGQNGQAGEPPASVSLAALLALAASRFVIRWQTEPNPTQPAGEKPGYFLPRLDRFRFLTRCKFPPGLRKISELPGERRACCFGACVRSRSLSSSARHHQGFHGPCGHQKAKRLGMITPSSHSSRPFCNKKTLHNTLAVLSTNPLALSYRGSSQPCPSGRVITARLFRTIVYRHPKKSTNKHNKRGKRVNQTVESTRQRRAPVPSTFFPSLLSIHLRQHGTNRRSIG